MKKIVIVIFLLLLKTSVFSQKIIETKPDEFTGEVLVSTSWEKIKSGNGFTGKNNLLFKLADVDNEICLFLKWVTVDRTSVDKDDKIIFKMNDNSLVTLKCFNYTYSGKGDGVTGLGMSGIEGISLVYLGNMDKFADNNIYATKVRIETNEGNVDIDLDEKNTRKINKAYQLLIEKIGPRENTVRNADYKPDSNITGFWGLTFKMTSEEVLDKLTDKVDSEQINSFKNSDFWKKGEQELIIFNNINFGGRDFDICYLLFVNNQLKSGRFKKTFSDPEKAAGFEKGLKEDLKSKYGPGLEFGDNYEEMSWDDAARNTTIFLYPKIEKNTGLTFFLIYDDLSLKENASDI